MKLLLKRIIFGGGGELKIFARDIRERERERERERASKRVCVQSEFPFVLLCRGL